MPVPGVLANIAGELTTVVADQSGPRVCVLFDWVAGRSLRTCLTERRLAALGALWRDPPHPPPTPSGPGPGCGT